MPSVAQPAMNIDFIPPSVQALHNTRRGPDRGMRLDAIDAHVSMIFQRPFDTERIGRGLRIAMELESAATAALSDDLRPFARLPMLAALYLTYRQRLAFDGAGVFDTNGLVTFVAAHLNESIDMARTLVVGTPAAEHAYRSLRMTEDARGIGAVMTGFVPAGTGNAPATRQENNVDLVLLSSRLSTGGVSQRALCGVNLQGAVLEGEMIMNLDLSDTDLSGACFYHCRWHDVLLARTDLRRALFLGGELRRCRFDAAMLRFAEWRGHEFPVNAANDGCHDQAASETMAAADNALHSSQRLGSSDCPTPSSIEDRRRLGIVETDFMQCDLSDVHITGTVWTKSGLCNSTLSRASIAYTAFRECVLADLTAPDTHWKGIALSKTALQRMHCPDSLITQLQAKNSTSLTHANFERCRLQHVRLQTTTTLDTLDFTDARLTNVSFEGEMKVVKARLMAMEMPQHPSMTHLKFRRTAVNEVRFLQCKLQGVQFDSMAMSGVRFQGCDLADTHFQNCTEVDPIGSSVRNIAMHTRFVGTQGVMSPVSLIGLTDVTHATRQLDFIGNPFGLLGRVLSLPNADIRTQLIGAILERVSAIPDPTALDSPLLTALMRDEHAADPRINAYIERRLWQRLAEFNETPMPIPILSPASAWIERCPGRLCRLIESLNDPQQFRRYSPLLAFLLIGAKHNAIIMDPADIACAERVQRASLPSDFPSFALDSHRHEPPTRPLGLFLSEDGCTAVILHTDAERIILDPVHAALPRHPFVAIVRGLEKWGIDRSVSPLHTLSRFPMLHQCLRPRFA